MKKYKNQIIDLYYCAMGCYGGNLLAAFKALFSGDRKFKAAVTLMANRYFKKCKIKCLKALKRFLT